MSNINRINVGKRLSDMAVHDSAAFGAIVEQVKAKLAA